MSPSPHIPYGEEDALCRILAHHQIAPTRKLVEHLSALIKWVHEEEQAKASFDRRTRPPMLSVLLSTLGIYGKEILGPPPRAATDRVTSDKKEETS
jgi:hypothetical protein